MLSKKIKVCAFQTVAFLHRLAAIVLYIYLHYLSLNFHNFSPLPAS